jgi:hypothetical protein
MYHDYGRQRSKLSLRSKSNGFCKVSEDKKRSISSSAMQRDSEASFTALKEKEMRMYFEKCVEMVKKEISRRKNASHKLNQYHPGNVIEFEDFKKVDFYRLLELVFGN